MGGRNYLVDREGNTLTAPFHALRQASVYGLGEHALIAHAVETLGYVHIQDCSRGLIVFHRRPITNPVILAGLIYLLTDLPDKRVAFSVVDGLSRYSLCRGRAQAIGKLVQEMRALEKTVPNAGMSVGRKPFAAQRRAK